MRENSGWNRDEVCPGLPVAWDKVIEQMKGFEHQGMSAPAICGVCERPVWVVPVHPDVFWCGCSDGHVGGPEGCIEALVARWLVGGVLRDRRGGGFNI